MIGLNIEDIHIITEILRQYPEITEKLSFLDQEPREHKEWVRMSILQLKGNGLDELVSAISVIIRG